MFLVPVLFLLIQLCNASAQAATHLPLKSYSKINRIVVTRLLQDPSFQIGVYLLEHPVYTEEPLPGDPLSLLGTYDGSDTNAGFSNGDPNALNLLLWYIDLNLFADAIAQNCLPDQERKFDGLGNPIYLNATAKQALQPLCQWPAASAQTDEVLYAFWSALLGFDAPLEEFNAWKTFVQQNPEYKTAPRTTVVSNIIFAALFNPYFLLAD